MTELTILSQLTTRQNQFHLLLLVRTAARQDMLQYLHFAVRLRFALQQLRPFVSDRQELLPLHLDREADLLVGLIGVHGITP